jgi:hypothetical protein
VRNTTRSYTRWDDRIRQGHLKDRRARAFDERVAQHPLRSTLTDEQRLSAFLEAIVTFDDELAVALLSAGRVKRRTTIAGVFNHLVSALRETAYRPLTRATCCNPWKLPILAVDPQGNLHEKQPVEAESSAQPTLTTT